MSEITKLSFHIMTHYQYTTAQVASTLEAVACSIRDGEETGCVEIAGKTLGYWSYDNPNKNKLIEVTKKTNQWTK